MRIEADRGKCAGLGMCEAMAPDFFEVGEDGTVVVLAERPGEGTGPTSPRRSAPVPCSP